MFDKFRRRRNENKPLSKRQLKKLEKARLKKVPEDIIEDFKLAEERFRESDGKISPYEILFKISNERRLKDNAQKKYGNESTIRRERIREFKEREYPAKKSVKSIDGGKFIHATPARQRISSNIDKYDSREHSSDKRVSSNSKRSIFSNFNRRR